MTRFTVPADFPAVTSDGWRGLRLTVAALAMLALAIPAAGGEDSWHELRAAGFVVSGDVSRDDLGLVLRDLQAFRSALPPLYPQLSADTVTPTHVVVFQDMRAFKRFVPRDGHDRALSNVAGFFLAGAATDFIVVGRTGKAFDRRAILHEFVHRMLSLRADTLPLWLNEGFAEFYSTFDRGGDRAAAVVGEPPADALAELRNGGFLPLTRIVSATPSSKFLGDVDQMRMFYAESWALVHYLLVGRPGASNAEMMVFLDALERHIALEDALKSAFGFTLRQLDNELRAYVRLPFFRDVPAAPVPAGPDVPPAVDMSAAAVHGLFGDLLLRAGTLNEAQRELAVSLAAEPADLAARVAMARVALATGAGDEGRAALRRLAEEFPDDFAVRYFLGGALALGRDYDGAFLSFDAAVRLRPGSVYALFAFSSVALALGLEDASEAAMQRLMEIDFKPDAYRTRAYSALELGRDAAAATSARRYIDAVGWHEPSAQAIAFVAVVACLRSNKPAEAAALLQEVQSAAAPSSWSGAIAQFLLGVLPADRLLARAKDQPQKTAAHTYIGLKALVEGRRADALAHFRWVQEQGTRTEPGFGVAIEELVKLQGTLTP